jgi:hypothetical protein
MKKSVPTKFLQSPSSTKVVLPSRARGMSNRKKTLSSKLAPVHYHETHSTLQPVMTRIGVLAAAMPVRKALYLRYGISTDQIKQLIEAFTTIEPRSFSHPRSYANHALT